MSMDESPLSDVARPRPQRRLTGHSGKHTVVPRLGVLVRVVVDAGIEVEERTRRRVGGATVLRVPPYRPVVEARARPRHGREQR